MIDDLAGVPISNVALTAIATFVIGEFPDAPKTRGTYGISRLLARSGIQDFEYDGRPKQDWLVNTLSHLSDTQFLCFLRQLLSPHENGGDEASRLATARLNLMLLPGGIQVECIGQRIKVTKIDESTAQAVVTAGSHDGLAVPDIEQLDLSADEARRLLVGWDEAVRCFSAGAFLACTIMLGSLLEALLLLALQRNRKVVSAAGIRCIDNKNNERPIEKWTLSEMIDAAARLNWTTPRLTSFGHSLRMYRNYVHPELRRRLEELPKSHECLIGSIVLRGTVEELRSAINASQ